MPNHKTHTETNSRINEIRSDEVQEILSHVPNWMIRWGITLIFALIILLVGLSWIIKYPDTIQGSLILTTKEPPIELVSKSSGQISHLFVPNNYQIKKDNYTLERSIFPFLSTSTNSIVAPITEIVIYRIVL